MFTILLYDSNYVSYKIIVPQTFIIQMQTIDFCIGNLNRIVEYVLRL